MIGNKLTPFKFWCQKVLPTVYDDSLSYYEYLNKLNEYLNEVIEQINTLTEAEENFQEDLSAQWTAYKNGLNTEWTVYKTGLTAEWNEYKTQLTQAWTETKNYIDNYFDNLDVQEEINNKLDVMATDGTLSNLIEGVIGNDIPSVVTAWLTEHVDPVGSAVVVDDTLTISGAAADAKVTGDKIANNGGIDDYHFGQGFAVSSNIANNVDVATGSISSDGSINTGSTNYHYTVPFIPVDGGSDYTSQYITAIALYDAHKTFISRFDVGTALRTFTFNANVAFIRLSSNIATYRWRLNKGTSLIDVPYSVSLKEDVIVKNKIIFENTVKQMQEAIFRNTENLFGLDNFNDNVAILGDGTESTNYSYCASGFIPVTPSINVVGYHCLYICEYDMNKAFIRRVSSSDGVSITLSDNTYYVRISSNYNPVTWQLNVGTTLATFSYGGLETSLSLTKKASRSKDLIIYSENISNKYLIENPPTFELTTDDTSAQIYSAYDTLVTNYPNYVSKVSLGNDEFGNEISLYKFVPPMPSASQDTKTPIVFINCGIHGYEKISPIVTYYVMKEIIEHWNTNTILEVFRHDVIFYVIPVSNPSGWDANTRTNGNNVDLNRNFPAGFALTEAYNGTTPLSQLETQYINSVLANNEIDVFIDFHNFSRFDDRPQQFMWIVSTDSLTQNVAKKYISRMTRIFKEAYSFVTQTDNVMFGYTDGDRLGMSKDQAKKDGALISCTFELCGVMGEQPNGTRFNTEHRQACMECLINFIAIALETIRIQYREPNEGRGQSDY